MSAPEPTASNTVQAPQAQEPPFIKFPPFPEPPSGVTIMPFKDFKPRGIQLFSEPKMKEKTDGSEDEGNAELDALGIPTVELRVKHATDECKSNSRKKRKKKKTAANAAGVTGEAAAVPIKKSRWYEEWEEGEDLRVTKVRYDASVSAVDRFFQSALDFRTGRPWPPVSSGLNNLWDQFRLFTGLLINPSVYRKTTAKKGAQRAESPDFESDDEDDAASDAKDGPANTDSRPTKRQRSNEGPDGGAKDDTEMNDPQKMDEELREEKITLFLDDPDKSVRIFLSSYMREQGLIWAERNLINTPRLILFFFAFVLRNHVLPEPAYLRGMKQALEMAEGAKKELPLTHKVGQSIPDAVNKAFRECFGRKGGMNWSTVNATTTTSTTTEQKDATIPVTDMSTGNKANVRIPTELETQIKDAIEDNVDMDVSVDVPTVDAIPINENTEGGWGGGEGWGNEWGDGGSWDQNAWPGGESWSNGDTQGAQGRATSGTTAGSVHDANSVWYRDPSSLIPLLGPSVLPLTHTAGIVESSTRRVVAIHFPPGHPKGATSPPSLSLQDDVVSTLSGARAGDGLDWAPSASGVEAELDTRFAKVVLEPWGREEGDISWPEIWETSRGPVIDLKNVKKNDKKNEVSAATDRSDASGSAAGRKPHDPLKDNITLLVQSSLAETLEEVPGLGLGAIWIEIARRKCGYGAGGAGEVDTSIPGKFWYHEDVTGIFPSFYTPREKGY